MATFSRKDKEDHIIANCEFLIEESVKAMRTNIARVLAAGPIDVDDYNPEVNSMVLPKSIVAALLEECADQYDLSHTSHKKEFLSDKKNIKLFI